jgi:hypothetical protein
MHAILITVSQHDIWHPSYVALNLGATYRIIEL